MYTKGDIVADLARIGIRPDDTLLVHSSMKAVGLVEGGADTVLDAFIEYLRGGLLIFPTHTWADVRGEGDVFDVRTSPSCVGLLTNLFMKRIGAVRALHPTHSVAAIGRDALAYVCGEDKVDTPCGRTGCWGKLYDRRAKILFLGCSLKTNTYLHGVEEWNDVPNRLSDDHKRMRVVDYAGRAVDRPMRTHHAVGIEDVSRHYAKLEPAFLHRGIAREGRIGDARSVLCDAVGVADLTGAFLSRNPALFADNDAIPEDWYK